MIASRPVPRLVAARYDVAMADSDRLKQSHAWRSQFRARSHEAAHETEHAHAAPVCEHAMVFRGKAQLIDTATALGELLSRIRQTGSFAFDSEFIGELSYVPKLCLIQVATCNEIALVDPLAPLDLMPLWELLADASVEKVVHAGAQDMEPVLRLLGKPAAGVIDTQIAAGFARLPYPISLQRLVLHTLDVKLGKGLTFTDWQQRPLSPQQMRYAADDVRYLPAAWAELRKSVEASGAIDWVRQECDAMCQMPPYQFDPETSFMKVRGAGTVDPRHLGVLRQLAIWRNDVARQADLPVRALVADEVLVELARRAPASEEKLLGVRGLPRELRVAHGQAILDAVAQGLKEHIGSIRELRKSEEVPSEQFRTDSINALAQSLCMARGIDPQLVFARSDTAELLRAIAAGRKTDGCRLLQSWRKELIGQQLLDLLTKGGRAELACENGELIHSIAPHPQQGDQTV